jgi:hypothetical protein
MTRKALSQRGVIEVLIRQGAVIPCGICRLAFKLEDVPFIERGHERCQHTFPDDQMEDWDAVERQRYVHGRNDPNHRGCHAAETARDRKIRDKVRRLIGETKQRPKAKIRSAGFLSPEKRKEIKDRVMKERQQREVR